MERKEPPHLNILGHEDTGRLKDLGIKSRLNYYLTLFSSSQNRVNKIQESEDYDDYFSL